MRRDVIDRDQGTHGSTTLEPSQSGAIGTGGELLGFKHLQQPAQAVPGRQGGDQADFALFQIGGRRLHSVQLKIHSWIDFMSPRCSETFSPVPKVSQKVRLCKRARVFREPQGLQNHTWIFHECKYENVNELISICVRVILALSLAENPSHSSYLE